MYWGNNFSTGGGKILVELQKFTTLREKLIRFSFFETNSSQFRSWTYFTEINSSHNPFLNELHGF